MLINKYDIFIFELNNSIVDIKKYEYEAWKQTLNINFTYEFFYYNFYLNDIDNIKLYLYNTLNIDNYDEIINMKNKNYLNILNEYINDIKLLDGFTELINYIINNNKKFIIVADNYIDNTNFFLKLFPILNKAEIFHYYKELSNYSLDIINNFTNNNTIYFTYYESIANIIKDKMKVIYIFKQSYNEIINNLLEEKIINTLRILSIDMINKANSGHPGMPLGCAPMMFILWCKIMDINNDKFILSNGHGCSLLYSILYLFGLYTLDDLKTFRQLHSKCHGHPEYNTDLGIEMTTGPLGQGIANGVGMAISSKKLKLNNYIYVMCGDGCLMEGISYEACSLAGHLELNNLILLYDSNHITIDGNINLTFTENIKNRFESQNWNVLEVLNGDTDTEDIYNKLVLAKISNKPTIIIINTTIGYGSLKAGSNSCHGSPLGDNNTIELKKYFNFNINDTFIIDNDVKTYFNKFKLLRKSLIYNKINYIVLDNIENYINISTRELSNICLNIINKNNNNIIIGSADLTESTRTIIESDYINKNNFDNKYIHFGIRENAMVSIANGMSCYNIIPIISTFLIFINYCLAGIRLAALSKHKVIYILTHDSVLIGEDGPTHQPIESLTILRSIPNLITIRPYNMYEVFNGYNYALSYNGPTALILSRQNIINYSNIYNNFYYGAYIIYDPPYNVDLIIIATGSEVELAFDTIREIKDINIRIISMPSTNIFDLQDDEYKNKLLPKNIKKISVEAGATLGWYKYANYVYGINTFGASGNINDIKKYFNLNITSFKNFIYDIYFE